MPIYYWRFRSLAINDSKSWLSLVHLTSRLKKQTTVEVRVPNAQSMISLLTLIGLQCHNALYTWKLVFGFDQQWHEMILCASSAREEDQWKSELLISSKADNAIPAASDLTFLAVKMRSLGLIFGQPGSLSRRYSMQRAALVDRPKTGYQVIIRNTSSAQEGQDSPKSPSGTFNRSASLLLTSRIPVLAPERADRVRLEHALEGVWTKELLPFPGMTTHRVGNFVRVSKNSVMRKLSKASTNTQSSKHSLSCTSLDDPFVEATSPEESQSVAPEVAAEQKVVTPISTIRSELEGYSIPSEAVVIKESAREPAPDQMKISFNVTKPSKNRGTSENTVITSDDLDPEDRDDERTNRPKKNKTLLKAFSAEGIRTWFA